MLKGIGGNNFQIQQQQAFEKVLTDHGTNSQQVASIFSQKGDKAAIAFMASKGIDVPQSPDGSTQTGSAQKNSAAIDAAKNSFNQLLASAGLTEEEVKQAYESGGDTAVKELLNSKGLEMAEAPEGTPKNTGSEQRIFSGNSGNKDFKEYTKILKDIGVTEEVIKKAGLTKKNIEEAYDSGGDTAVRGLLQSKSVDTTKGPESLPKNGSGIVRSDQIPGTFDMKS